MKDRKDWNNGYWWGWAVGIIGANIGHIIGRLFL